MTPFVSREKMSKKARRELDSRKRAAWRISPVTRRAENKKAYSRKRKPRIRWDEQLPFFMSVQPELCRAVSTTSLMRGPDRCAMIISVTNRIPKRGGKRKPKIRTNGGAKGLLRQKDQLAWQTG